TSKNHHLSVIPAKQESSVFGVKGLKTLDPSLRWGDGVIRGFPQGTSKNRLSPFQPRSISVRGEVSNHERRGKLADCPSIREAYPVLSLSKHQGDGSIPHHARGFHSWHRDEGEPVFRGPPQYRWVSAARRKA